jgi:ferric-dicitrate binding protein FerR (iron transport regulator)
VWQNRHRKEQLNASDSFNKHLQRLSNHLDDNVLRYETGEQPAVEPIVANKVRKWYTRSLVIYAVAASVIIAILIPVLNKSHVDSKQSSLPFAQNLVSTRNGSKTKIQLPDGTQVWLNADSKIAYGNDFTGSYRQVSLKGEAFFDVVKDASRPFIIHTDAVDIKVLGTAFNVRSYSNEKVMETALIRGSIEVTLHQNPGKKIILKPNEKLIVKNDSVVVPASDIKAKSNDKQIPLLTLTQVHHVREGADSATMETLWTKNKLVFDGETLQQVALKLERWYGVKVTIQSNQLKNVEYSGVFDDEELPEVLYALKVSGNFNYSIKKKEVIIEP